MRQNPVGEPAATAPGKRLARSVKATMIGPAKGPPPQSKPMKRASLRCAIAEVEQGSRKIFLIEPKKLLIPNQWGTF
jgi:hypothetical protein